MPPSGSIILCTEEDYADTRKPRLRAAGIQTGQFRDYIRFVRGVKVTEDDDMFTRNLALLEDISKLRQRLEQFPHIKLIVFDPLSDYYGTEKSENSNQEIRQVLKPLTDLLQETRVAGVGIAHFGKQVGMKAAQKTLGSTAIMAVARMGWGCIKAENGNKDHRLMLCVKGNITRRKVGMLYTSESAPVSWTGKDGNPVSTEMWRIKWLQESEQDIDEIMSTAPEDNNKVTECVRIIQEELADQKWHDSEPIKAKCKRDVRCEEGTIKKAAKNAGVNYRPKKGAGKRTEWQIGPQQDELNAPVTPEEQAAVAASLEKVA